LLNAGEDFKRLVEQHIYTFYIYSPSFAVNIVLQNLQKSLISNSNPYEPTSVENSMDAVENSMDAVIKEFDFFSANHQDNKDAPSNVDVSACFLTLGIIDLVTH
jgi:hypothetical protein